MIVFNDETNAFACIRELICHIGSMIGGMCSFLRLEEMGLRFWRFFLHEVSGRDEVRATSQSARVKVPSAGGTPDDEVGPSHMDGFFKGSMCLSIIIEKVVNIYFVRRRYILSENEV